MNIYHYTTMDALKGIIQNDSLCFWGSRYDSMNDPRDYTYARDIILPRIKRNVESEKLISKEEKEFTEEYPYIVSFSKAKDDELMWRLYHAEVALELDRNIIKRELKKQKEFILFHDCIYPKEHEIAEAFIKLYNKLNYDANVLDKAQETVSLIKHHSFNIEKEVRMVKFDYKTFVANHKGGIIDTEIPVDVGIKSIKNGDFVFYKKFFLPKNSLKGIIVRSYNRGRFERIEKHIKLFMLMNKYSLSNIEVVQTQSCPVE